MRTAIGLTSATLLAGALIGGTAWAQEKKPVPVSYTLNWYPQAEHGGLFHAKADGIYERYGLDVTIRPGGPSRVHRQRLRLPRGKPAARSRCSLRAQPATPCLVNDGPAG